MLKAASVRSLVPPAQRQRGPVRGRREVEELLPHRDPFLFIDRITFVDRSTATIVCRLDLARTASIFEGHFPRRPVWPGVLQVEAIGQAGLCLARLLDEGSGDAGASGFAMTHILGARFARPVTPSGDLEIVSRILPDGPFTILVGQCLQHDAICCAAALRGLNDERPL